MADAPQGIVLFNGVRAFLSAQYTRTHGVQPNVCTIRMAPQPGKLLESGTLTFTYGRTRLAFPDCKVDTVQFEYDSEGREIWTLNILDRRWKWRIGGHVSGYYNVRRGSGVVPATLKKPQELAKLCLDAMGEVRCDLRKLPNDAFPEIEWDYTLAADALEKLCQSLGCRLVLKLDDTLAIEKIGEGRALPTGGQLTNQSALDPPERPDEIRFVTARAKCQVDLDLEAVAEDEDGEIKPLFKTSYGPDIRRAGIDWNYYDLFANSILPQRVRELAKREAYRRYRIVCSKASPVSFYRPDRQRMLATDLAQITPTEELQLDKEFKNGELRRKPAVVWGTFWTEKDGGSNSYGPDGITRNPRFPNGLDLDDHPEWICPYEFDYDPVKGTIYFAEPITCRQRIGTIRIGDGAGGSNPHFAFSPAILKLRTTIGFREVDTRAWYRAAVGRRSRAKKFGTMPEILLHDDCEAWAINVGDRLTTNLDEINESAKHYLDEKEREYEPDDSQAITYAGLLDIELDGAIQQVTWMIDDAGYATTAAHRNREDVLLAQTNAERQLFRGIQNALDMDARLLGERGARERLAKGA